ncbi:hypothetical protein HX866_18665 [Pseudomonas gingeri]|uniref:hypothetical protein n=1 Tax=Pseudomonas gingeri TaxID=117681 RepID=UPI0015A1FF83|nr:hypothetical protein [Pseudomonas gingeri]NWA26912.1 hypothetical protein [Pseudomonas gingeri]
MVSEQQPLILEQRVSKHADTDLHCHEVSLRLSDDQRHLILSRYSEHYSPLGSQSAERHYQVPTADALRWLVQRAEQSA